MLEARAPGKLLLTGEYAVLEGAPAVAVAIGVRATATVTDGHGWSLRTPAGDFPFSVESGPGLRWISADPGGPGHLPAALFAELVERYPQWQPRPSTIELDSAAFRRGDAQGRAIKMGLGSSAAVLVALAGAVTRATGLLLSAPEFDALCLAAHQRFQQGRGSGVDVLTAIHGELVAVMPGSGSVAAQALHWPSGLHLVMVWSGAAASTPAMIDAWNAYRVRRTAAARRLGALTDAAGAAAGAWQAGRPAAILAATEQYATALRQMDDEGGIGIFTPTHRQLALLAEQAGAVYKTSGAGGGDLGFALTDSRQIAGQLHKVFSGAGFPPVQMEIAVPGLQVDAPEAY